MTNLSGLNGNLCQECEEGFLKPRTGSGRTFELRRGLALELPEDLEIATCDNPECGEMAFDDAMLAHVSEQLQPKLAQLQAEHIAMLTDTLQKQTGCSLREIELACGVTPTYLSHVRRGGKDASEVLVGLLEAFAIYPDEFKRRLARANCFDTESVRRAISSRKAHSYLELASEVAAPVLKEVHWVNLLSRFMAGVEHEKRSVSSCPPARVDTGPRAEAEPTYADVIELAPFRKRPMGSQGGWTKASENRAAGA